jgi:hypothetical protein
MKIRLTGMPCCRVVIIQVEQHADSCHFAGFCGCGPLPDFRPMPPIVLAPTLLPSGHKASLIGSHPRADRGTGSISLKGSTKGAKLSRQICAAKHSGAGHSENL